jgi:hypothetical protein
MIVNVKDASFRLFHGVRFVAGRFQNNSITRFARLLLTPTIAATQDKFSLTGSA